MRADYDKELDLLKEQMKAEYDKDKGNSICNTNTNTNIILILILILRKFEKSA